MFTSLLASLLLFYFVSSPFVDMRELPKADSEVVSQAYASEEVNVLGEDHDWIKIETVADHYQGWIQKGHLIERQTPFLSSASVVVSKVNRPMAHIYSLQDTVYGPILTVPFDTKLEVLEPKNDTDSRWIKVLLVDGREAYIQRGDVKLDQTPLTRERMCALSQQFLTLPYTWGGRSGFGYDCSGFVQMLYRQMGLALPRDSKDQIRWARFSEIPVENLVAGDLVFFGLTKEKIRHVGLYLGNGQFIHTTVRENKPWTRISQLTDFEWSGDSNAYYPYRAARALKDL